MSNQPVYKIIFHNGKQIFEVFAKHIYQSDMWGFVEIEEMLFGERSAILVDPGERNSSPSLRELSAAISRCNPSSNR